MHVSLRFEAPGSERRHIVGKGLHRQLPIACRSQSKTNRATLLWGALTMAVDFKSPPLQLLTGALADWLFFKCFSGLGTSVDLTFARPPSRCGATGRSVCAQIALVSSPHTTLGRSTPGGGGTLLARGLLLPPRLFRTLHLEPGLTWAPRAARLHTRAHHSARAPSSGRCTVARGSAATPRARLWRAVRLSTTARPWCES